MRLPILIITPLASAMFFTFHKTSAISLPIERQDEPLSSTLVRTKPNDDDLRTPVHGAAKRSRNVLGFQKGYNRLLFAVLGGFMTVFVLSQLRLLNITGEHPSSFKNSSMPGEWYRLGQSWNRIGLTMHLWTCLPSALLMVSQFIPRLRRKWPNLHRVSGYFIAILTIFSTTGALMIARDSFGGGLDSQTAIGTLAIITSMSLGMGIYTARHLRFDQHRAWMLRFAAYMGSALTSRPIGMLMALSISRTADYGQIQTCAEILSLYRGDQKALLRIYPLCATEKSVIVKATFANGQLEQIGAALRISMGSAVWIALVLHMVLVEVYLHLTEEENETLQQICHARRRNVLKTDAVSS